MFNFNVFHQIILYQIYRLGKIHKHQFTIHGICYLIELRDKLNTKKYNIITGFMQSNLL